MISNVIRFTILSSSAALLYTFIIDFFCDRYFLFLKHVVEYNSITYLLHGTIIKL